MRSRALGRALTISEIGFGAWGIGGSTPGATSYGATDDQASLHAIRKAFDLGITFFDTSSVYGYGHSEDLLGQALESVRSQVVLATKAGLVRYGDPVDLAPAAIRKSLELSLRRLRTDRVDLLQLHNPSPERMRKADDLLRLRDALLAEGKIRAFGVSVREPSDGLAAIESLRPDAIQVNFNLLDRRAIDCGLFSAAQAAGCGLIARTPLCFGFLSGAINEQTAFAADDHRGRWPPEQIAWWAKGGRAMLEGMPRGESASQFALRFCLSFPAISSVIPGILTEQEASENAAASNLGPLDDPVLRAIDATYRRLEQPPGKPTDPGKIDRAPARASS
jgi:aryl-alcohol dehydrogenase-like predicted oxidoreductase